MEVCKGPSSVLSFTVSADSFLRGAATRTLKSSSIKSKGSSSTFPIITASNVQDKQKPKQDSSEACVTRRGILGVLSALTAGSSLEQESSFSAYAAAPPSASCEFTVAPSGLGFCDTTVGSGLPASKGMVIKVDYVGRLEDGKVFDSSYNRGKPFSFTIGVGQVIKGWDEGILGGDGIPPMLAGGKRRLKIPPQLGYGERGAGCRGGSCVIPPNSVLLFDVEFLGKAY